MGASSRNGGALHDVATTRLCAYGVERLNGGRFGVECRRMDHHQPRSVGKPALRQSRACLAAGCTINKDPCVRPKNPDATAGAGGLFRVSGLGFRVSVFGFQGLGFRVRGFGFRAGRG